jgi:histone acetyltransferase
LDPSPKTIFFHQYEHDLTYRLVTNDGTDQALMWLLTARNVFHRELAQMPENYISKLVFNRHHRTVVLLKSGVVLGGICFRPFPELDFAEIAFCAVSSVEQIRGYGAHLMAQVKTYLQALQIHNILTYADNSAVGYFKRQGFTLEINFDPNIWSHCIKDYQGATLIHCRIHPDIDYLHLNAIIDCQKQFASKLMPDAELLTVTAWPVQTICGIKITEKPRINIVDQMRLVVMKAKQHSRSWPFLKPVSKSEAPNYYEIVKTPMDLSLLEKNVNEGKYQSLETFERDLRLIFSNCYQYNGDDSVYSKSARELEQYVNSLLSKTRPGSRR